VLGFGSPKLSRRRPGVGLKLPWGGLSGLLGLCNRVFSNVMGILCNRAFSCEIRVFLCNSVFFAIEVFQCKGRFSCAIGVFVCNRGFPM